MEDNSPALTVTSVLRAITSIFTIAVSIITGTYIIRQKGYKRMLYLMFLCLIFSIALSGVAHLIQSVVVNYTIWSEVNSTSNDFSIALCIISRSFLNYTSSFDIILITAIVLWLVKTLFTTTNEIDKKWITIKKHMRYILLGIIGIFPIAFSIFPIIAGAQKIYQGEYCELRIKNSTTKNAHGVLFILWYGVVFVMLVIDTILLLYCIIKFCWRLKISHNTMKSQYKEILKDSLSLALFVLIIYCLYCIEILTGFFLVILGYSDIFWGIQAMLVLVRGIAILVMFFNPRMRYKLKLMPYVTRSAPLLVKNNDIEDEIQTPVSSYSEITNS